MIKKLLRTGVLSVVFLSTVVMATEYGSREQAMAMAEKAVALIEEVGIEDARMSFETPTGEWHDRDLYVFVYDSTGTVLAHGAKSAMVGRNLYKLSDIDGVKIIQEFLLINPGQTGWVNYKWQNPMTKAIDKKSSYIIRQNDYLVGVGIHLD